MHTHFISLSLCFSSSSWKECAVYVCKGGRAPGPGVCVCYFCSASLCGLTEKRLQPARWHTEAALPALRKTTDTPEVHWLATLRSFVCLFFRFWRLHSNFSGEELSTQNGLLYCGTSREKLLESRRWQAGQGADEVGKVGRKVGRCFHILPETYYVHQTVERPALIGAECG